MKGNNVDLKTVRSDIRDSILRSDFSAQIQKLRSNFVSFPVNYLSYVFSRVEQQQQADSPQQILIISIQELLDFLVYDPDLSPSILSTILNISCESYLHHFKSLFLQIDHSILDKYFFGPERLSQFQNGQNKVNQICLNDSQSKGETTSLVKELFQGVFYFKFLVNLDSDNSDLSFLLFASKFVQSDLNANSEFMDPFIIFNCIDQLLQKRISKDNYNAIQQCLLNVEQIINQNAEIKPDRENIYLKKQMDGFKSILKEIEEKLLQESKKQINVTEKIENKSKTDQKVLTAIQKEQLQNKTKQTEINGKEEKTRKENVAKQTTEIKQTENQVINHNNSKNNKQNEQKLDKAAENKNFSDSKSNNDLQITNKLTDAQINKQMNEKQTKIQNIQIQQDISNKFTQQGTINIQIDPPIIDIQIQPENKSKVGNQNIKITNQQNTIVKNKQSELPHKSNKNQTTNSKQIQKDIPKYHDAQTSATQHKSAEDIQQHRPKSAEVEITVLPKQQVSTNNTYNDDIARSHSNPLDPSEVVPDIESFLGTGNNIFQQLPHSIFLPKTLEQLQPDGPGMPDMSFMPGMPTFNPLQLYTYKQPDYFEQPPGLPPLKNEVITLEVITLEKEVNNAEYSLQLLEKKLEIKRVEFLEDEPIVNKLDNGKEKLTIKVAIKVNEIKNILGIE
ncbi:Hypothetical_protein [Hexamita inflata]|uniref:Hypothetical_protein n=1 Tax=Hexamita inflata TaxID=28002 RepID=A0AA86UNR2_9EUKA|nr:Hypothetical protein HINF_LOCUS46397 [Hexamita inflata]